MSLLFPPRLAAVLLAAALVCGMTRTAVALDDSRPEAEYSRGYFERREATIRAMAGQPMKKPYVSPNRKYVRPQSYALLNFACRAFMLDEQNAAANEAIIDFCNLYRDDINFMRSGDSYYWAGDLLFCIMENFGSKGRYEHCSSRKPAQSWKRRPLAIRDAPETLFDPDGEFGGPAGVFGGIGGPFEPEAIVKGSRAGIAEHERGVGCRQKLELSFLIGTDLHPGLGTAGTVDLFGFGIRRINTRELEPFPVQVFQGDGILAKLLFEVPDLLLVPKGLLAVLGDIKSRETGPDDRTQRIFVKGPLVRDLRVGKNGPAGDLDGNFKRRLSVCFVAQLARENGFLEFGSRLIRGFEGLRFHHQLPDAAVRQSFQCEELQGDGQLDFATILVERHDFDASVLTDEELEGAAFGDGKIADPRLIQNGQLCACGLKTMNEREHGQQSHGSDLFRCHILVGTCLRQQAAQTAAWPDRRAGSVELKQGFNRSP